MKRSLSILSLLSLLAGLVAGCGATPQPTESAPTQTPWIIVVTATPGPERLAESQPTQTPWIIVATPTRATAGGAKPAQRATATLEPELTPTPTPTPLPPTPTDTPAADLLIYEAPVLLEPPSGLVVPWKGKMLLKWSSVGKLGPDEYYHLHFERPPITEGQTWYGDYVFTKSTEYLAEAAFLDPFHPPAEQGQGKVYWWVRVVRKTGEDANGKPLGVDISLPSEKHSFLIDPKPGQS
jgi:hypothetical protein